MTQTKTTLSIGIDVAKKHLDVHCHQDQTYIRVCNTCAGIKKLLKWMQDKEGSAFIVLEPSGGYEYLIEQTVLSMPHIKFAKVNAKQIRDFARSKGQLAKTDAIDAQIIAEYGALMSPRVSVVTSEQQRELSGLVRRRRQVVKTLSDEANRLEKSKLPAAKDSIENLMSFLKSEVKALDKMIRDIIKSHDELQSLYKLAQELRGIGPIVAATLLAGLPELGRINNKAISSLIGVAPHNVDSGTMRGTRHIQGGRSYVRQSLYLAALTATRYDGPIRDFYISMLARGKKPKVAIIACMRKMIVTLNAKTRDFYAMNA
ncbi:MAG TPA: IS110 family transposase [Gammaproteobacteria bacterium]|nr:IS110 family transposase [Gammaproteobacteria bacterium]